ncbi:MAG: quinoprotein dehydrogenase-associated SoxYZ-like carrier [Xanthobacteraceae bacterium]|nr:quinoprotein dehydrogenase-associated SoxYZ-like carrier [Xanthobacteraceae bacterium]MBV9626915.1 quinoprotein dehydrogenase-associated SoxYZ-like carrier [Xanthobacteraceae bacterium]
MSATRRTFLRSTGLAAAAIGLARTGTLAATADDPWPDLARDAFNKRPINDGTGILTVEMPYRAEDASIVPVTIRSALAPGDERHVKAFTLVIDENPAPVAATFALGPNSGVASIATRVRVDSYTNVHAVAELDDGKLYMVATYVKASGGCSAPAAKNADEAIASLGQMRLRQFPPTDAAPASRPREAQIMVRHPNNSGLQMNQVTRLYVPAFFIQDLKVWQGDDLVFAMDGGISISEDPSIRFSYTPNGATTLRVEARDTENHVFKGEWPVQAQM